MSAEGVTQYLCWNVGGLSISQAKGQGLDADVLTLWRADGKSALIFVQSLASAKLVVSGGLNSRT